MSWNYDVASGRFTDPSGSLEGKGYSGQPPHVNIAADEALEGLGPIPRGRWQGVSLIEEHPKLGPFVIVLEPDDETRLKVLAMGRDPDSFRMHGERVDPPFGLASDGCIIQSRLVRMLFWNSQDHDIQVV